MIDLGVMADPKIQGKWTPKAPSLVESVIDNRRIRSFIISKLVLFWAVELILII